MTKKRFKRIKYSVDEKAGVVVAILENCEFNVINDIAHAFKIDPFSDLLECCKMNPTYRGIARCHPDDKFDLEKGKQIALQKLQYKYDVAFERTVDKLIEKTDNILAHLIDQTLGRV